LHVKVHPEGLGDIVISVVKDPGGITVRVEANQLQTMQWLQGQSNAIAQAVRDAGVTVSSIQVAFGQATLGRSSPGNGDPSDRRHRGGDGSQGRVLAARSRSVDVEPHYRVTDTLAEADTGINIRV